MKTKAFYLLLFCFFAITFRTFAQGGNPHISETEFKKYDKNESGWLSGNELAACNCKGYDTDNNNEVTLAEFKLGYKNKSVSTDKTKALTAPKKINTGLVTKSNSGNNSTGKTNIRGNWWFTAILYADGTVYELRNRQSNLDLMENGTYVLNTWLGGANNMRTTGKYIISGNRLTLNPSGGKAVNYTITGSANGQLMTMKANDGSGYNAERPK